MTRTPTHILLALLAIAILGLWVVDMRVGDSHVCKGVLWRGKCMEAVR